MSKLFAGFYGLSIHKIHISANKSYTIKLDLPIKSIFKEDY
jgi:hypothetical protein